MCVTVVRWSRSCSHVQINRMGLTATLFSVSLYRFFFFFLFSLCFLKQFFLLACLLLFLLLILLIMHLDQYVF